MCLLSGFKKAEKIMCRIMIFTGILLKRRTVFDFSMIAHVYSSSIHASLLSFFVDSQHVQEMTGLCASHVVFVLYVGSQQMNLGKKNYHIITNNYSILPLYIL